MTPPTPSPVPTPTMAQTPWRHRQRQALRANGIEIGGAQRADRMTHGFEIVDDVQVLEVLRLR